MILHSSSIAAPTNDIVRYCNLTGKQNSYLFYRPAFCRPLLFGHFSLSRIRRKRRFLKRETPQGKNVCATKKEREHERERERNRFRCGMQVSRCHGNTRQDRERLRLLHCRRHVGREEKERTHGRAVMKKRVLLAFDGDSLKRRIGHSIELPFGTRASCRTVVLSDVR